MNIDLWYDPVKTEIYLKVNDMWIDSDDAYGFLYPVRTFPIQSWINGNDSDYSLFRQLTEIARGDDIQLCFYGRSVDYRDINQSLNRAKSIFLSYKEWNTVHIWQTCLDEVANILRDILKAQIEIKSEEDLILDGPGTDLFPEAANTIRSAIETITYMCSNTEWLVYFAEGDELVTDSSSSCCILDVEKDTIQARSTLCKKLTGSLQRATDMLCYKAKNKANKDYIIDYIRNANQPHVRVICNSQEEKAEKHRMWEKYGICYSLRQGIRSWKNVKDELKRCNLKRELIQNEKNNIDLDDYVSYREQRILHERYRQMLFWIEMNVINIEKIDSLLSNTARPMQNSI